jgi:hypothetical protein
LDVKAHLDFIASVQAAVARNRNPTPEERERVQNALESFRKTVAEYVDALPGGLDMLSCRPDEFNPVLVFDASEKMRDHFDRWTLPIMIGFPPGAGPHHAEPGDIVGMHDQMRFVIRREVWNRAVALSGDPDPLDAPWR